MKTYNMIITACVLDKNGDLTWHKEELTGSLRQGMALLESVKGLATQAWLMIDGTVYQAIK